MRKASLSSPGLTLLVVFLLRPTEKEQEGGWGDPAAIESCFLWGAWERQESPSVLHRRELQKHHFLPASR